MYNINVYTFEPVFSHPPPFTGYPVRHDIANQAQRMSEEELLGDVIRIGHRYRKFGFKASKGRSQTMKLDLIREKTTSAKLKYCIQLNHNSDSDHKIVTLTCGHVKYKTSTSDRR